jgi:hypothetical protein
MDSAILSCSRGHIAILIKDLLFLSDMNGKLSFHQSDVIDINCIAGSMLFILRNENLYECHCDISSNQCKHHTEKICNNVITISLFNNYNLNTDNYYF